MIGLEMVLLGVGGLAVLIGCGCADNKHGSFSVSRCPVGPSHWKREHEHKVESSVALRCDRDEKVPTGPAENESPACQQGTGGVGVSNGGTTDYVADSACSSVGSEATGEKCRMNSCRCWNNFSA